MRRVLLLGFVLAATACGGKTFPSLCASQVPVPAECMVACNPTPNAADNCPGGFHCSGDGKCDTQCTATGGQCGADYSCTSDGRCVQNGSNPGGNDVDACPSAHVVAKAVTPTVELLLDQSGSMTAKYGATDRWNAMRNSLIDPTNGVVKKLAGKVAFGATLFSSKSQPDATGKQVGIAPCPTLTRAVNTGDPRVLNNFTAIQTMLQNANPDEDTPTAESINAVVTDFTTTHKPTIPGSPPIIVLATDGLPDTCADADPPAGARQDAVNAVTVKAAQDAYKAGVKIFYLFIGDEEAGNHPQQMANAGAGLDPATGKAKFYVATDPAQLAAAFDEIVGGVLSCDLSLNGQVSAEAAPNGTVTLDNVVLTYGTDWNISGDGLTLHILGKSCDTLKTTMGATVDATFACGTVIF